MPKIRKNFELTPADVQALAELRAAGYAFPENSDVAVIRKSLRASWKIVFKDKPYPEEEANEYPIPTR